MYFSYAIENQTFSVTYYFGRKNRDKNIFILQKKKNAAKIHVLRELQNAKKPQKTLQIKTVSPVTIASNSLAVLTTILTL